MNVEQCAKEIAVRVLHAMNMKATEASVECVARELRPELTRFAALQFSDTELLLLDYLADGMNAGEVCSKTQWNYKTVLMWLQQLRRKMGVACNTKMIEKARELGLVEMKHYEKDVLSLL